jgi:hypothetical protein
MSKKSWAVSEILELRIGAGGEKEVLVLWRPTWEPLAQMDDGEELIKFLEQEAKSDIKGLFPLVLIINLIFAQVIKAKSKMPKMIPRVGQKRRIRMMRRHLLWPSHRSRSLSEL